jgi:PAS domain S-box-containing protein
MTEILTPLTTEYGLIRPDNLWALIGWVIGFAGIILISIWLRDRRFRLDRSTLVWSATLSVLILVLTPFLGILPRTGLAAGAGEVPFQHLMFFAAVPWMLAGGVLGILPATILAGLSGLLLAYLDTQSIFTSLILMGTAVVFSWGLRQRYRTTFFKWLRFPVVAAIFSLIMTVPIVFLALTLSTPGTTAVKVAMAMVRFPMVMFPFGGMVLMGGLVCVIVQAFTQSSWGSQLPPIPAPGEIKIKHRLLAYAAPISMVIMIGVFISSWRVSQEHARKVMVSQMTGVSDVTVEGLNIFLETGERLIRDLASDLREISGSSESVSNLLDPPKQLLPYFDHFSLFDTDGNLLAGFEPGWGLESTSFLDFDGLADALLYEDSPIVFLASFGEDDQGTWVVFVSVVDDSSGQQANILWGQALLEDNRYAQTFIRAMDQLVRQGGYWQIIGDDRSVLLDWGRDGGSHGLIASSYTTQTFYQSRTADGQTLLHYVQPIPGTSWGISATLPGTTLQEMAWQATYPLLLITAGGVLILFLLIWVGLSLVLREMDMIVAAIDVVASKNYDLDEFREQSRGHKSYFSVAFQNMVMSLQHRIEKQAELLSLSGRVSGQLNSKDALHMILGAALTQGATSARLVFFDSTSAASPDDSDHRLGLGRHAKLLAAFDQDILDLSRGKDMMVLQGTEIIEWLPNTNGILDINFILIFPLKWKDLRLGVFWAAFTDGLTLAEDGLDYFKELAQMASTALVNAKTYADSQSTRMLMEAIFDLVPDAILITDHSGRVLIQNKHAQNVLGLNAGLLEGKAISSLFKKEDLVDNEWSMGPKTEAKTMILKGGKALFLITSPVRINPREVGQALIFKDLTEQRKEESLKSELVTTVSHELRSPLTLILGYAKILRLTGTLNEQQDVYIGNIIDGVEEMMSLVEKLLDIGRLEWGDPLEITSFSAEVFAHRVVNSMDAHAKQKNISIGLDLPELPVLIEADQTYLTQALRNLLENAIKFSKMDGEVTLRVRRSDDRIIFAVQDQGIGIAPLDQRKLFKKFGRTSAKNGQEQEGTGLGLAIVKSIAERHGGQVRLESQLGKGSTFYLEIPQKQPQ